MFSLLRLLPLGLAASFTLAASPGPRPPAEYEAAARLQVFLDRAEFAPGKIDGRYGEFTWKALALYRLSRGEKAPQVPADQPSGTLPDVAGLDLASIDPVFVSYTVTAEDLESVGELPADLAAQAALKFLPYASAAEALAEKFHADVKFLAELNPGRTTNIRPGDVLTVPNVEPFALAAVEAAAGAAYQRSRERRVRHPGPTKAPPPALTRAVRIDIPTNMLVLYEGESVIAAYPVTVGSDRTGTPAGDWKVRGVARMPNFRYDESMLNSGVRSDQFHLLPPGPNNPVGVTWIALDREGVGLHGTSEPDRIGRSASHGCVRLANWDIVRLAAKVKPGVPVSIR